MKRLCLYLFPVLTYLIPLALVGAMEQDSLPLVPGFLACLSSILLGWHTACKAGITYR